MPAQLLALLNIRVSEKRTASLLIGIMLFGAFGYSFGGTGIEALYFSRYGTAQLPYLYMGLGLLSLVTTLTITGLLGRVPRERMYIIVPLLTAGFIFVAWGVLFSEHQILFPLMWLAKESINTIVSMIAWNSAGAACDSRQAKRLFPIFSAARILGQVLGGLGVGALVESIGAHNLLLVWGGSMLMVFLFSQALLKSQLPPEPARRKYRKNRRGPSFVKEMQKGWEYVRRSPLMLWISLASILFSVLYFSVALPFSRTAANTYPSENELARFIGYFNGIMTAATFLTSLLLANRLFARWGIMNMLLVFPVLYLLGFGTLIVNETFAILSIFRFAQMLWLTGICDAAWQSMFSAVPAEKRDQVNAFLNGVPEQAGVFLAGGILLVGAQAFSAQQLYSVGLVTAAVTTYVIYKAARAYGGALADTLREGRPDIFSRPRGAPIDAVAMRLLTENLKSRDVSLRKLAAEILAETPGAARLLIPALHDSDSQIRIAALRGLVATPEAVPQIVPLLAAPEAGVRAQAVRTLRTHNAPPPNLGGLLEPLLQNSDPLVQVEAALGLLHRAGKHSLAESTLRHLAASLDVDIRIAALNAMAEWGDAEAFKFISTELNNRSASSSSRRAAAQALASSGRGAIPVLVFALADEDEAVSDAAAWALGQFGARAESAALNALEDEFRSNGALLAFENMSVGHLKEKLKKFAQQQIANALKYHEFARLIPAQTERLALLHNSLQARAQSEALQALRAIALTGHRDSFRVILDNLHSRDGNQRANALEMLESIPEAPVVRPLLSIWEFAEPTEIDTARIARSVTKLLTSRDTWLQACAAFAAHELPEAYAALEECIKTTDNSLIRELFPQGEAMHHIASLPVMERVLLLRHVPLLADLSPSDLQRVAAISSEDRVAAGEVVFEQGDPGDKMFVIVRGEVRIISESDGVEKEVARRGVGDVVGEMSLISGEPRSATLIADTDMQFLCLDRRSFEGLLRERPEVSLAVMRELCKRLKDMMK